MFPPLSQRLQETDDPNLVCDKYQTAATYAGNGESQVAPTWLWQFTNTACPDFVRQSGVMPADWAPCQTPETFSDAL